MKGLLSRGVDSWPFEVLPWSGCMSECFGVYREMFPFVL